MNRHTEGEPEVMVEAGETVLPGFLALPEGAIGIVLFAHGSGSSRFSRRNRFVARRLNEAGLATLLFDLLTPRENEVDILTAEFRFDIPLLTRRLGEAVDWVSRHPESRHLPVGLFGASTGAAAALGVAAAQPEAIRAVVSRGGRPDLAGDLLPRVNAPTLLIVGGEDHPVIEMNRDAMERIGGEVKLELVPGATHLFEEPGTLEAVALLARAWFARYLKG